MAPRTPTREPWKGEPSAEPEATSVERQLGLRPLPKQEVIAANHRLAIYDQGSQIGPLRGFKVGWTSRNREMSLREDMHTDLVEHMRALLQANLSYDLWQINEHQRHEAAMEQIKNAGTEFRSSLLEKVTSHAYTTKQLTEIIEVSATPRWPRRPRPSSPTRSTRSPATPLRSRTVIEFGVDGSGKPVTRNITPLYCGLHVIGQMGRGKSTLLARMFVSGTKKAGGLLIDPAGRRGGLITEVLDHISADRADDVLYWDPATQVNNPWAGNFWQTEDEADLPLACEWFKYALRSMGKDEDWRIYIDQASEHAFWALAPEGYTINDIPRLFRDRGFRLTLYPALEQRNQPAFEWFTEFDEGVSRKGKATKDTADKAAPLIRRVEQLTTNPVLRTIFGQTGHSFDLGQIMAEGKILLVRLSEADLGPGARQVLANLLMGQLFRHAKHRQPEEPPYLVVVDEVNSLIHAGWTTLIEQARQFKVALVLAHQNLGHVKDPDIRNALLLLPNRVSFAISGVDLHAVSSSYPEDIGPALRQLPKYQAIARLDNDLDGGHTTTLLKVSPINSSPTGQAEAIIQRSNALGRPRAEVELEIRSRDRRGFKITETVSQTDTPETVPLWD